MNRTILVAVLLFAVTGRAQEEVDAPLAPATPKESRADFALWTTSPFGHWGLMVFGPPMGIGLHAALPVGLNVRMSDTADWVFEVTPMFMRDSCTSFARGPERCGRVRALKASAGVAWTPWPGARGDGLFIQPRVAGMWLHDAARGTVLTGGVEPRDERREMGGQVTLGFDLGYRKTAARSRAFLAPVIGVGVGYAWNQRREAFDFGALYGLPKGREWKDQAIVDVSLDILRFGATF